MAQPLAAPRNRRSTDAVQFQISECRDVQMQIPESTCSFNTFPVRPPENCRSADGFTMHNKGILRPPQRVPSDQFSFVHAEHRPKSQREVPPPHSYSNRHHFVQSMRRENFYNNHERLEPSPYEYRERWNSRTPYSGKIMINDDACDIWGRRGGWPCRDFSLVVNECINDYLSFEFLLHVP